MTENTESVELYTKDIYNGLETYLKSLETQKEYLERRIQENRIAIEKTNQAMKNLKKLMGQSPQGV